MSESSEYFEILKQEYISDYQESEVFAYENISENLDKIKETHRSRIAGSKDFGQSWRSIKGGLFENIVKFIIDFECERIGLSTISDSGVRKLGINDELFAIKDQIQIDYEKHGKLIPDADIIIYSKNNLKVLAIVSCKVTLRERIAQTGYWNLKLQQKNKEKEVKYFLVTLDQDGDFANLNKNKRSRTIAETDTDGVFVVSKDVLPRGKTYNFSALIRELYDLEKLRNS